MLLHFPRADYNRRKASVRAARWVSIVFRNSSIFFRSNWCGELLRGFSLSFMKKKMFCQWIACSILCQSDNATWKWDENTQVICWLYRHFECIVCYHCMSLCWHGIVRVFAVWRWCCRFDYTQFAWKWNVSSGFSWHRSVRSSGIPNNFSRTYSVYRLAQAVQAMLAFGIFITHGIACYVAIDLVWTNYVVEKITNDSKKLLYEYVVRTLIVLVTCKLPKIIHLIIHNLPANSIHTFIKQNNFPPFFYRAWKSVLLAVAIPNLELFISLFGALCLSSLGLAFPALFESCVFLKHKSGFAKYVMIAKNIIIGLVGLAGFIVGTSTSLSGIVRTFFE